MSQMTNRIAKAERFADAITANGNTLAEVKVYDTLDWTEVALAIGENPPSADTVALILTILKERNVDPFDIPPGRDYAESRGGKRK